MFPSVSTNTPPIRTFPCACLFISIHIHLHPHPRTFSIPIIGRVVSSNHDDHHAAEGADKETDVLHGNLRVSVTDTGAGIAIEDQGKLFKTVVQFRPEVLQAGGGSGFGMFISAGSY